MLLGSIGTMKSVLLFTGLVDVTMINNDSFGFAVKSSQNVNDISDLDSDTLDLPDDVAAFSSCAAKQKITATNKHQIMISVKSV